MSPLIGVTASITVRGPAFGETYTLSRRYVDAVQAAGAESAAHQVRVDVEHGQLGQRLLETDGCFL